MSILNTHSGDMHARFHQLWSASVGGPGYSKQEWKDLEAQFTDAIVSINHPVMQKAEELHRFHAHSYSLAYCCLAPKRNE
mgnify:CR=1 FL=1